MRSIRPFACPPAVRPATPAYVGAPAPGRAPSRREEVAIAAAVRRSPLLAHVPVAAYAVIDVRLSVAAPGWAYARLAPYPGDTSWSATLDPVVAMLDRRGSRWSLAEIGTAFAGRGAVPWEVLREFRLG